MNGPDCEAAPPLCSLCECTQTAEVNEIMDAMRVIREDFIYNYKVNRMLTATAAL